MSNYPPSSDPWSGGPQVVGPPLASWGQRLAAWLIDFLIGFGIGIAGEIVASTLGSTSSGLRRLVLFLSSLAQLGFWIWNHVRQGQTGQTIGKGVLNIRLARLDGVNPPGVWLSIGRGLLHIIDALPCFLGFLWPLWDEKRQTFTDKILNTVVVGA